MLRRLTIRARIFGLLVVVSAVSVTGFGILTYRAVSHTLRAESFRKLTALREMKAQQTEAYFRSIADEVVALSESRTVIEAMEAFRQAFIEMREAPAASAEPSRLIAYYRDQFLPRLRQTAGPQTEPRSLSTYLPASAGARQLQALYIAGNPHPAGAKQDLVDPGDGSAYSAAHRIYHPIFTHFLHRLGYYDIFLVDADSGNVVYTVCKELDFATSVVSGPFRDSHLARAVRTAARSTEPHAVTLIDFAAYEPSYHAPAAFIACPVFVQDRSIGVLVFQLPIDRINEIMTSQQRWPDVGLGVTGETYLVGEDFRMRTPSRLFLEYPADYLARMRSQGASPWNLRRMEELGTTMGLQTVDTPATRAALAGRIETGVGPDYRGVTVLSSSGPLELPGLRWALVSQIDAAEAFAALATLRIRMMQVSAALLGAVLILAAFFARTLTRPIQELTAKANALAQGHLDVAVDTRGRDEIAQLAGSFESMRRALRHLIQDLEQRVEARAGEVRRREREFRMLADNVPALFAYVDPDLRYRFADKSYETFFHLPVDQIVGRKVSELMDAEAWARIEPRLKSALAGQTVEYEIEIPVPAGSSRWFKARYVPNREGDRVEGVFVLALDITERKEIEQTLRISQADLRRLSSELAMAAERERQRIASELHDELGQILAMCQNELDRLELRGRPATGPQSTERLRELLARAVDDTRELTFELSSPLLHSIGLDSALEQLCHDFQRESGLRIVFRSDHQPKPMSDTRRMVFFRSVRELLINAAKHAHASEVRCTLARHGDSVRAEVVDNGIGFDASRAGQSLGPRGGFGLFNMRESVEYSGGRLEISSAPGDGTRVLLELPAMEARAA